MPARDLEQSTQVGGSDTAQLSRADLVRELERARELAAQLQQALESRVVIEQAKGVLAERLGVSVDQAFELLRSEARPQRLRLHDLAARVVHERDTPSPWSDR